jgi:hypothetical protein
MAFLGCIKTLFCLMKYMSRHDREKKICGSRSKSNEALTNTIFVTHRYVRKLERKISKILFMPLMVRMPLVLRKSAALHVFFYEEIFPIQTHTSFCLREASSDDKRIP